MNALQVFSFDQANIRCVERDGDPWFVASDIARALEYRDAYAMTRNLDDYEKGTHSVSTLGGTQEMTVINESGLYSAIFASRKTEAKAFKRWVTSEVLPSIRKTGGYQIDTEKLANMVLELSAKIDLLTSKPKAEFIKVKDIANMIGSGYTSNDVNQALMVIGLQVKYHNGRQSVWMPTNKAKAYCKKIGSGLIWNANYISEVKDKIQQVLEIKV